MQGGKTSCEHSICFLGKRMVVVTGPKSRLDVPNRNAGIETGQSATEGGCCVSLDDHEIEAVAKDSFQALDNSSGCAEQVSGRRSSRRGRSLGSTPKIPST